MAEQQARAVRLASTRHAAVSGRAGPRSPPPPSRCSAPPRRPTAGPASASSPENTSLVRGRDTAFSDWLAREHVTDRWQQVNQVVGVCWCDTTALTDERIAYLARVHAEDHGLDTASPFRLVGAPAALRRVRTPWASTAAASSSTDGDRQTQLGNHMWACHRL